MLPRISRRNPVTVTNLWDGGRSPKCKKSLRGGKGNRFTRAVFHVLVVARAVASHVRAVASHVLVVARAVASHVLVVARAVASHVLVVARAVASASPSLLSVPAPSRCQSRPSRCQSSCQCQLLVLPHPSCCQFPLNTQSASESIACASRAAPNHCQCQLLVVASPNMQIYLPLSFKTTECASASSSSLPVPAPSRCQCPLNTHSPMSWSLPEQLPVSGPCCCHCQLLVLPHQSPCQCQLLVVVSAH